MEGLKMKFVKLKGITVASMAFAAVLALQGSLAFAEDAHKGHSHGTEKKSAHGHEGAHSDLGTTTVSGMKITALQIGKVEAGKEGIFEVEFDKGTPAPKAVRLWVGVASGEGSTKAKADKEGSVYEAHTEVPKSLPAGSALWVEIQPEKGNKIKASFSLKK
jgi:hypothetical protein